MCARTFDGWGCWDDTPANSTAFIPCPTFMPGFLPDRMAFKVCLEDGTWFRHPLTNRTWSNYTTCIDQDDLSFRQKINNLYISGYTISVIALLVSLGIFFSFTWVAFLEMTVIDTCNKSRRMTDKDKKLPLLL
jgi:calcitonin receptor-like